MAGALAAGVVLLMGLWLLGRWFIGADTKQVKKAAIWTVGGLLLGGFLFLAVTGRLHYAAGAAAALGAWAFRFLRAAWAWRMFKGLFGGGLGGGMGGGGFGGPSGTPPPGGGTGGGTGKSSTIRTRFLEMALYHDSGAMEGTVVAGEFAGRTLSSLAEDELKRLWAETATDEDSRRVLVSWLDRTRGAEDWAARFGADDDAPSSTGPMTEAEAWRILGLEPGASAADIKNSYRRLMSKLHPDSGGSDYLAAKINEARDLLLDRAKH